MQAAPIRVLVVDDHDDVRNILVRRLDHETDMSVVGSAPDGLQGVAMATSHRPDVVVMDVRMPGINGLEALRQIKALGHARFVVLVSGYDDAELACAASDAGADGFFLKGTPSTELVSLVRAFAAQL